MFSQEMMIRVFQAKHDKCASQCATAMGFGNNYFHEIKSGRRRANVQHLKDLAAFGKINLSELIAMGES